MDEQEYWKEFATRTHTDPVSGRKFQYNDKRERVYISEPEPELLPKKEEPNNTVKSKWNF